MQKQIKRFLMVMAIVLAIASGNKSKADAASISNAKTYSMGTTESGSLKDDTNEQQYYKFSLSSSGKVEMTGLAYMEWIYLYIYDENANEIWRTNPSWNSTSEVIAINDYVYLTSGTYYFCVGYDGYDGNYNFKLETVSSNETFKETNGGSNNSLSTANVVSTNGQLYHAQLALNDEKDFWKFTLNTSGTVNWNATFYNMKWVYWNLYDAAGNELLSDNSSWNSTTTNIAVSRKFCLTKGTYYISTKLDSGWDGKYDFSLSFSSANESYTETNGGSNNTLATASAMSIGKSYKGQIAINDEKDFYKVKLSSKKSLVFKINAPLERLCFEIFDAKGNEIKSEYLFCNDTTNSISYAKVMVLNKGTYYVALERGSDYNGNYTISAQYLTRSNCPHEEYEETWHSATYFSKGYCQHRCEMCGRTYRTNYQSVKKLRTGCLYSYCFTGKGSLKVLWYTVSDATGYQIRYSKNKKFKSGVKTVTVKGRSKNKKLLKKLSRKKKYYVQVRAYKKSGSKTVYGKWSSKKCFKTR